jgi:hypothetical protein
MRSKQQLAGRPSSARTRYSRAPVFVVAIAFAALAAVPPALADSTDEAINTAVDALAAGGYSVGISITPTESRIFKQVLHDIIVEKKSIPDALKDAVMAPLIGALNLPPQIQDGVQCFISGKSATDCALKQMPPDVQAAIKRCATNPTDAEKCIHDAVIGALPPQAQQAAQCLARGDSLEKCAQDTVIGNLPKDAQGAAQCLARGTKVEDCAKQFASDQLAQTLRNMQQAAVNQADNFFRAAPSELQNIINLVQAIQNGSVEQMLASAGAAATKLVVKQVLNTLLPGPVVGLLGPVIDRIIQDRVDLATALVQAAKKGDVALATEIAIEAYLIFQIDGQCALLRAAPLVPGAFVDATCGELGKLIAAVGKTANEIAQYIEGLVQDPRNILNVPRDVVDETGKIIQETREKIAGKDNNCSSFPEYYAKRYAICLPAAASKKITNLAAYASFATQLEMQCHQYFDQCYFSSKWRPVCDSMRDNFNRQADQIDQAVRTAASTYSRDMWHYVRTRGGCGEQVGFAKVICDAAPACDPAFLDWGYKEFIGQCAGAVGRQVPLTGGDDTINSDNSDHDDGSGISLSTNCVPSQPRFAGPGDSPGEQACRANATRERFQQMAAQVCRQNSIPRGSAAADAIKGALGDPIPPVWLNPSSLIQKNPASRIILGNPIPPPGTTTIRPVRHPAWPFPKAEPIVPNPPPSVTLQSGPSRRQILQGSSGGGSSPAMSTGGCPPYMTPDGRGGCTGISMVQPGGISVPRPGPSGGGPSPVVGTGGTPTGTGSGNASTMGTRGCPPYMTPDSGGGCVGASSVQKGGVSVPPPGPKSGTSNTGSASKTIDSTYKGSGVIKSGSTGAANTIRRVPNTANKTTVLRSSPAATAIRKQKYDPYFVK